jgi:hypothetical protein
MRPSDSFLRAVDGVRIFDDAADAGLLRRAPLDRDDSWIEGIRFALALGLGRDFHCVVKEYAGVRARNLMIIRGNRAASVFAARITGARDSECGEWAEPPTDHFVGGSADAVTSAIRDRLRPRVDPWAEDYPLFVSTDVTWLFAPRAWWPARLSWRVEGLEWRPIT